MGDKRLSATDKKSDCVKTPCVDSPWGQSVESSEAEIRIAKTTEFQKVSNNPLVTKLLNSIQGMLAVVDKDRRVVALNSSFLEQLDIRDAHRSMGLKLGDALECNHAKQEPGGCGTTSFCPTCGAALAILASAKTNAAAEELCSLSRQRDGEHQELFFLVKANPVEIDGQVYIILLLQDVTEFQQKAVFERAFFHDMSNLLCGVIGASSILMEGEEQEKYAKMVYGASKRLANEMKLQQCLSKNETDCYTPVPETVTVQQVFDELDFFLANHPARLKKQIDYVKRLLDAAVVTDMSLLVRVLFNMVLNALEASETGDKVAVWADTKDARLRFNVWNKTKIPEHIMPRIFERNFSTKAKIGRGVGTFSMKLFGEKLLGGTVDCTTAEAGTVFSFQVGSL